jgi:ABC-type antimicrobial peptide transport system permease subunit
MLSIRNRKAEFAVMRSMGASGGYVFYISFIEQAVLCLIGALIGVLVSLIGFKQLSATQINKVLIFIGCYLAGTAIEALRIASVKVMKIMKAND